MTPEKFEEVLPETVRCRREALRPERIYLFGSCAAGTPGRYSELDLLVVVPELRQGFYQRAAEDSWALDGVDVPIDVFVYTRAEFDRRAEQACSLEHAVATGGN